MSAAGGQHTAAQVVARHLISKHIDALVGLVLDSEWDLAEIDLADREDVTWYIRNWLNVSGAVDDRRLADAVAILTSETRREAAEQAAVREDFQ